MHPLLARAFGAPTTIAHGMWTTARCLAAFAGWVPEILSMQTEFRSPLRIPGRAQLLSGRTERGWLFRVESPDAERAHVVGDIAV
jgi:acyl dehydratase